MKIFFRSAILTIVCAATASAAFAISPALTVGSSIPAFTYREINSKVLRPGDLRGHPFVLWLVAAWCSSCQTGSSVIGNHIDMLAQRGIKVVELRLAGDLGAPGPGLQTFQRAVGPKAFSHNWYWAEASKRQTLMLDPHGYADLYYLVDARGKIIAVDGNPAVSWGTIQKFAETVRVR